MRGALVLSFVLTVLFNNHAYSQEQANPREGALEVFVECNFCDMDYLRANIGYVNYVRDRKAAQIHILTTSQRTGSGGTEYTFNFIGQLDFEGQDDSISVVTRADATSDERREARVKILRIGLMRYVAQTPMVEFLSVAYSAEDDSSTTETAVDNWDYWVFRLSGRGWFNGQEFYQSKNLNGSFSANRITEKWKIENWASYRYNDSTYKLDSVTDVFNSNESYFLESSAVGAINEHWSAGASVFANSSTFSNMDLSYGGGPAIEYNIFKYSDFTTKQIRLKYNIGLNRNHYVDTTLFNKTEETLVRHRFSVSAEFVQKWGSISVSSSAAQYLHDTSLRNMSIWGNVSWRILKGLSLNFGGNIDFIQDQIALPKGGASEVEILTQQRQLATQYSYWGSAGISYTFGSIYNNIVNPRFGN